MYFGLYTRPYRLHFPVSASLISEWGAQGKVMAKILFGELDYRRN